MSGAGTGGKHEIWTDEEDIPNLLARVSNPSLAILDFDETLWLRNSTEEFLNHVRPSIVAALILQLLGFIKPWRFVSLSQSEHYRDWFRVGAILLLMPWSYLTWRHVARDKGLRHLNTVLLDAVASSGVERVVVASLGFQFIIAPLLAPVAHRVELLLSSSILRGAELRRQGKGCALSELFDEVVLKRAIFVTDSAVDEDIASICGHSFYTKWEDASYSQAGLRPLLPLSYTARVKRPEENYVLHGIIGYDFVVGLLAYVAGADTPVPTILVFTLYLLGFFAVYEVGYYENDTYALKYEAKPRVSKTFSSLGSYFSVRWAWCFGIVLLGLGAALQTVTEGGEFFGRKSFGFPVFAIYWLSAIVMVAATRLIFYWFNSLRPRHRILPMFGLQIARTLGYALMLPIAWPGVLLCLSHAFARWTPYTIYRYGGQRKGFPSHIVALLLFVVFASGIAVALKGDWHEFVSVQFLLIVVYLVARALKESVKYIREPGGD